MTDQGINDELPAADQDFPQNSVSENIS